MVAPAWPYVAVREIDYVVMRDDRGEPFEWHRARAYNPGDPVSPTAVVGDPEAAPDAWLTVGPDVVRREDYPPTEKSTHGTENVSRSRGNRLGRKPAPPLSERPDGAAGD